MAPSLSVTSLVTLAFVAVDGLRRANRVNSSYTPNTGCQGRIDHHWNYGNTLDNCGGVFETDMNNPLTGGEHKKQPPHGGWFMVDTTNRRRHRWYCNNNWEWHDCGEGNCMQVWHHSRRRFPINCGHCTCNQPRATGARVCLDQKYSFQGGSSGSLFESVRIKVGTFQRSYTTRDTVISASASASASLDGVIPQITATFGLTASTQTTVTNSFHSAFEESRNVEYEVIKNLTINMELPVYIVHSQAYITFEDGSEARMGDADLLQFNTPQQTGCFSYNPF